nr:very short patch repair endonuclease [Mycolicibacterium smegmatis]
MSTTPETSRRMSSQSTKNTQAELRLRSLLHAKGLRYRVHRRPINEHRRIADIVFPRAKIAVFVDGCFWHGCPEHGTWPRRNGEFWRSKIEGNIARDRETDALLRTAGWLPIRIWEHEDMRDAADRLTAAVRSRFVE